MIVLEIVVAISAYGLLAINAYYSYLIFKVLKQNEIKINKLDILSNYGKFRRLSKKAKVERYDKIWRMYIYTSFMGFLLLFVAAILMLHRKKQLDFIIDLF